MITTAPTNDVRQHILNTAQQIMGCRGFSAVGLNEILRTAGVPKGSFYHYFASKEAFGVVMLEAYFSGYMAHLETMLGHKNTPTVQRLMAYWTHWLETQMDDTPTSKCLVVKLGAEVCDLSESMRTELLGGTDRIIKRLAACIEEGIVDASLNPETNASETAQVLYQMWLGASVLAKITHNRDPFYVALDATRRILQKNNC